MEKTSEKENKENPKAGSLQNSNKASRRRRNKKEKDGREKEKQNTTPNKTVIPTEEDKVEAVKIERGKLGVRGKHKRLLEVRGSPFSDFHDFVPTVEVEQYVKPIKESVYLGKTKESKEKINDPEKIEKPVDADTTNQLKISTDQEISKIRSPLDNITEEENSNKSSRSQSQHKRNTKWPNCYNGFCECSQYTRPLCERLPEMLEDLHRPFVRKKNSFTDTQSDPVLRFKEFADVFSQRTSKTKYE